MNCFCSFTSGSKGNSAIYIKDNTRILIDAGTNTKYITSCLKELGLTAKDLTHIVLTHAHRDHISALPVLLKHTDARLVCSEGTYQQLPVRVDEPILFWEGESLTLGDVEVKTAPTPHDCFGSCCYSFGEGEGSLAYCTDLGKVTPEIFELMRRCRNLFIESNHDVEMLRNGPYPYYLKQRVLSNSGHLSNKDCANIVSRLAIEGVEKVMLGHLSETNNLPRLAIGESYQALERMGADSDVLLGAAAARQMPAPMELR